MTLFQIIIFGMSLWFAYQVYRHILQLEDTTLPPVAPVSVVPSLSELITEADSAYRRGELGESKRLLEHAHQLNRSDTEVLSKLGFVTLELGEVEEAIATYAHLLSLDPEDDLIHNAIASAYRKIHAYERARHHYEEALRIDDAYAPTYYNYGNLCVEEGDHAQARTMYIKAQALDPSLDQVAQALESLKLKEKA